MKRKFAVIMSAALAAGSTMPVMAESETAFTPSTYVGEFSLTADGESMLFSITAEQFAEDGVSVSANVTLPPSVTGEEADTVYGLMMYFALFLVIFILMSLKLQVHMVNC